MVKTENHLKQRFREQWAPVSFQNTQWRQPVGQEAVVNSTQTVVMADSGWEYHGFDIPNYHERVKRGELMCMTPFTRFTREGSCYGSVDYYNSSGTHYWATNWLQYGTWRLYGTDLSAYVPDYTDKYVQEAAAKIYSTGFDALTNIAELASVKRMFSSVAKKIARLQFPRNWRAFTNQWLEYRYGWRILQMDIRNLSEAIANLNEARTRYSERAGTAWSSSHDDVISHTYSVSVINEYIHDVVKVGLRGSVAADIEVPQFQFNPLQTAWEVIPYSFVVDWILGVGTALSALSFMAHVKDYTAAKGYSITMDREYSYEVDEWTQSGYYGTNSGSGSCTATLSNRAPCLIPFLPQFTLRINPAKIVDSVALILQRIH